MLAGHIRVSIFDPPVYNTERTLPLQPRVALTIFAEHFALLLTLVANTETHILASDSVPLKEVLMPLVTGPLLGTSIH